MHNTIKLIKFNTFLQMQTASSKSNHLLVKRVSTEHIA